MSDVEFNKFKVLLKTKGHFVTQPRMHMFGLLQHHPAVTTNELMGLVQKHDRATVYRTISLFEKLGIINILRLGWHTKIELSDVFQHHHHHLSCVRCGKVSTLEENELIENQIVKMAANKGFKLLDHQLEIRGYCSNCKKLS